METAAPVSFNIIDDLVIDKACVRYHAFEAKFDALRASFPPREGYTNPSPSAVMTPAEVIANLAMAPIEVANIFLEILLFASKHVPTCSNYDNSDVLEVGLRRVIMEMIGQLALDAAFAAVNTGNLDWLNVIVALNKLMDSAVIQMEHIVTKPFITAMQLAGTGYMASNVLLDCPHFSKALAEDLKDDALDAIMHACVVFITGKFAHRNVDWNPVGIEVPKDIRFYPLFTIRSRAVYVPKDASLLPHHVTMAVRQLQSLALVSPLLDH